MLLAILMLAGCGGNNGPKSIDIPGQDALSSETAPEDTTTPPQQTLQARTPRAGSLGALLSSSKRVDNGDYHRGATEDGGTSRTISEFAFTADGLTCATQSGDSPRLVCSVSGVRNLTASPPSTCTKARTQLVLDGAGARPQACSSSDTVYATATRLPQGKSISVDTFTCLNSERGLTCMASRPQTGFAVSGGRVVTVDGTDPAPGD
ncbi:hypothetical protein SAMN05445060_2295 [Williamsia sterculiae]|uniref:Uncharacterized protein n=1 Tax=Williamsia sterculiae TaxID=1344003 RepID=A0A1N7FUC5_9NOCA|nr:hypothetical protein SAMN05445060_2295 [Williamsia sterculiae]